MQYDKILNKTTMLQCGFKFKLVRKQSNSEEIHGTNHKSNKKMTTMKKAKTTQKEQKCVAVQTATN